MASFRKRMQLLQLEDHIKLRLQSLKQIAFPPPHISQPSNLSITKIYLKIIVEKLHKGII